MAPNSAEGQNWAEGPKAGQRPKNWAKGPKTGLEARNRAEGPKLAPTQIKIMLAEDQLE